jgi:hypothetical protein
LKDETFKNRLSERERLAKERKRTFSVWTGTLKDETVSEAKVVAGETRLFMNPPADFTLLLRKYTGAFSSFCFLQNLNIGCAAGFNPESGEWTTLAYLLTKINEIVGALDYKRFDSTILAMILNKVCWIINKWYDDAQEHQNVREVLFHELVYTIILIMGVLYIKYKGNPSGGALTMIINNLASKLLLRFYWVTCAPPAYADVAFFRTQCTSFVCGDDNIFAIPPYIDIEGEAIIASARTLGMTATSERKDTRSVFKPLTETTFLKRGFRYELSKVKPTLDIKTIDNMLTWITNSKFMTPRECIQLNAECAMRYLYFWGPEIFNYYFNLLNKLDLELDLELPLYSYRYYNNLFESTGQLDFGFYQ